MKKLNLLTSYVIILLFTDCFCSALLAQDLFDIFENKIRKVSNNNESLKLEIDNFIKEAKLTKDQFITDEEFDKQLQGKVIKQFSHKVKVDSIELIFPLSINKFEFKNCDGSYRNNYKNPLSGFDYNINKGKLVLISPKQLKFNNGLKEHGGFFNDLHFYGHGLVKFVSLNDLRKEYGLEIKMTELSADKAKYIYQIIKDKPIKIQLNFYIMHSGEFLEFFLKKAKIYLGDDENKVFASLETRANNSKMLLFSGICLGIYYQDKYNSKYGLLETDFSYTEWQFQL